jgi:sugar phosphate permease
MQARRRLQARTFALTWLSYASYYATRKNLSVAKSRLDHDLQLGVGWLGAIDTAYLVAYAAGQFGNGALGDRVGARRTIAFGMLASAGACAAFGAGSAAPVFLAAFGLNGLFQATGWPNNVKTMGYWFGRRLRGRVMGLWSTNYQVGGLVATAAAAAILVRFGWRAAFWVPAVWTAAVGLLVLVLLVEKPADRGLPPTEEDGPPPAGEGPRRSPFLEMIRVPAVWVLGGSYFGLKLIRYSLLFWLPFFLTRRLGYAEDAAGYLSTAFEAGGIAGAIAVGWVADRRFSANPMRLVVPLLAALALALLALRWAAPLHAWGVALGLGAVGFLLFGPDTLICGAAAQDLGRGRATASAAGIINGFGSIGAACQGMLTAGITAAWGWDALFLTFVALALASALALVPLALRRRF